MNYLSYQDEKRRIVEEPSQANFATVVGVYEDGLQLQFDGESEATAKRYRYNKSITFKLGDRVKVTRVSGTYVAEYPIGKGKFSVAPDNVSGINATAGETEVSIQWSDPADKTVDGQLVSKWAGTYLVRNEIDFPKNETDGTQVLNSQTRDAYKSTPFVDKGLTSGKTYYYGLFPYSDDGKVNTNRENTFSLMPEKRYQYGVKIDLNNADPETSVEYILDAVGKRPAKVNLETGEFDYGDWADVGFVKDCKPCMLRYDGTVDYYLNPNDYSKKEDGTPSNISDINYPANAMVEFPLWYLTQYEESGFLYIIVSQDQYNSHSQTNAFLTSSGGKCNKIYIGMFLSHSESDRNLMSIEGTIPSDNQFLSTSIFRSPQEKIGPSYCFSSFCERDYISALLILISKSLNLKNAFGYGPSTPNQIGNTVSSQFFGMKEAANKTMNVFHLKNWWGDPYLLAGLLINNREKYSSGTSGETPYVQYYIDNKPPYDEYLTQKRYPISLSTNVLVSTPGGYISKIDTSNAIKLPIEFLGSSNTRYCDYGEINVGSGYVDYWGCGGDKNAGGLGIVKKDVMEKLFARISCHP